MNNPVDLLAEKRKAYAAALALVEKLFHEVTDLELEALRYLLDERLNSSMTAVNAAAE